MSRLRDLVVVVPGIGGSILERDGVVIWDADTARIIKSLCNPESLAWSPGDRVAAVGLVKSVTLMPGFTVIHGYDRLVNELERQFVGANVDTGTCTVAREDADIVLCPYDFRQDLDRSAEALEARLRPPLDAQPERQIVVIAHSMGGLVARRWLAMHPGRRSRCRASFTLGTPFHGAPKALDWFVNGIRLGSRVFTAATEAIRTWPSLYDLLPRGPAVLDVAKGEPFRLRDRILAPLDQRWLMVALDRHDDTDTIWQEFMTSSTAPDLIPYVGFGHGTPQRPAWREGALAVSKGRAEWWEQPDWHGDGTVPAYSAVPAELFNRPARFLRVSARHGPLVNEADLIARVEQVEEIGPAPMRRPDQSRPTLGIDVEDWYPTGQGIAISACLFDVDGLADASPGARVWAHVRQTGMPAPRPVPLERSRDAWTLEIGPFDAGTFQVTVSATGVAGGEPRDVREVFVVVDE